MQTESFEDYYNFIKMLKLEDQFKKFRDFIQAKIKY